MATSPEYFTESWTEESEGHHPVAKESDITEYMHRRLGVYSEREGAGIPILQAKEQLFILKRMVRL